MTKSEWFTLAIALWGAVLSTIIAIKELADKRRSLKVFAGINYIAIPDGQQEAVFSISCVNKGVRPIILDSYGILMPKLPNIGFRDEHPDPQQFPTTLTESQVFGVLAYGRQLMRLFHPTGYTGEFYVRGYIRDNTGKVYKSKKIKIDYNKLFISAQ